MSRQQPFWTPVPALASLFALSLLAGCGGEGGGGKTPTQPDTPKATSISLSPSTVSLEAIGATQQLSATVKDQNGHNMSGASVTWNSSNTSAATVSGAGSVTAVAVGTATISARAGTATGTASVSVTQTVIAVAITAPTETLNALGETVQYAAEVQDANGHSIPGATVIWSSSNPECVQIDEATGLATAVAFGAVSIIATSGSASDSAALAVIHIPSANRELLSFSFLQSKNPTLSADAAGEIDGEDVVLLIPRSVDAAQLVPTFNVSPGATVEVDGIQQVDGETGNDFTAVIRYTVVAEDQSQRVYTVYVGRLLEDGEVLGWQRDAGFFRYHSDPRDIKLLEATRLHLDSTFTRIADTLHATLTDTIDLEVYPTKAAFHDKMREMGRDPQDWWIGTAPRSDWFLVVSANSPDHYMPVDKFLSLVLHEGTHSIIASIPRPGGIWVPGWLNEGLAGLEKDLVADCFPDCVYNWDNQKEHIISEGKPGLATMFDDPSVGYAFCFTTPLFIVKRYGWDALQTFLTDPSDYSVFGLADSNAFEARWSGFLDELFGLVTPAETIAQARSKGSGLATVEGTVTWQTQWDDRVYFLQDETAGISTFHTDGAIPLSEGDQIRITGQVDSFRGEIHINTITEITVLGQGAVPSATLVTGAEINAGQYQGELVEVVGTVQTIQELAYGNQRVTVRDAAGTDLPVYGDSRNGMATADWPAVGTSVRVTGVLGTDDRSDVPEGTGPRLEPRRKGDVVTVDTASLTVTTTDVGEARVGVPYNGLLEAIAGTGTGYTWSLQSGGLPSGVTLSASGTLTGTPSASGSFPFTARVDDDGGGSATAALELYSCGAVLSLGVGESLVTPFPDRCGLVLPDADAGYRVALMTRDQVYESYAVASLPGGLQMSAIAGTPGVEFLMPPQMPVMKVRSPLPEDQAFDPETLELAKATARLSWRLREEEYRSRPNAPMTVPSVLGPPLADLDVPPVELGPPPASRQFMVFDQGQGVDVTINATLRAFDDNVEYYEDAGEVGIAEDLGVVTDGTQATAQEITDLLAYYETYGKPIIDDAFGGLGPAGTTNNFKTDAGVVLTLPTDDIDQNGRLIVLQIREDRLGGAGAYVSACDRYPLLEHYNAGGNYCPRSNEAEITFFSRPDHVGFLGTLVHEAKHISSLGYAIFGGRGFNPSWIEEGTAQIARGKSSRDAAGFTDGARVGLEDMYPGGPSTAENMGMVAVNWWARSFLKASPLSGLIGDPNPNPNPNASNYYGASWLFHRFLVDAYGVGDEDSFFLSLNTGGSGVAQIEAITGQTFETLLAEFLVAIGVEGQASARAATTRRFTAYDFAGIAERWPSDGPWPYLQATAGFTTGTFSFATHYTSPSFFDYTTGGGAALRLDAFTSAASALNAGDDVVMVITRIR